MFRKALQTPWAASCVHEATPNVIAFLNPSYQRMNVKHEESIWGSSTKSDRRTARRKAPLSLNKDLQFTVHYHNAALALTTFMSCGCQTCGLSKLCQRHRQLIALHKCKGNVTLTCCRAIHCFTTSYVPNMAAFPGISLMRVGTMPL